MFHEKGLQYREFKLVLGRGWHRDEPPFAGRWSMKLSSFYFNSLWSRLATLGFFSTPKMVMAGTWK